MARVSTSELNGPALDWAVAKAEGHRVVVLTVAEQKARWFEDVPAEKLAKEADAFATYIEPTLKPELRVVGEDGYKRHPTHAEAAMAYGAGIPRFAYSTNWAQGGPIIDRERINVEPFRDINGDQWSADGAWNSPTALIAAMRCYVASKLGDEVDVPEELAC